MRVVHAIPFVALLGVLVAGSLAEAAQPPTRAGLELTAAQSGPDDEPLDAVVTPTAETAPEITPPPIEPTPIPSTDTETMDQGSPQSTDQENLDQGQATGGTRTGPHRGCNREAPWRDDDRQ